MKKFLLFVLAFFSIVGCQDPEKSYFGEIQKRGFIPFQNPIANVGVGTIFRGTPAKLTPMGPAAHCFPEEIMGEPTNIRWSTEVDLPHTYRNVQLDFNASLNSIMAVGTPGIKFNLAMNKVRKVEFTVRGAQIERFDHFALQEFYWEKMTEKCLKLVKKYPFDYEVLKVTSMSFTFLDSFGGKIALNLSNISDFASMGADINWKIENNYDLVVTSPKYVGYKMSKFRDEDDGLINWISDEVKRNVFIWKELSEE